MQHLPDGRLVRNKDYWRMEGPEPTGPHENIEGAFLDNKRPSLVEEVTRRLEPIVDGHPNLTISIHFMGAIPEQQFKLMTESDGGPHELQEVGDRFHSLALRIGEDRHWWHIVSNPPNSLYASAVREALNIQEESLNLCERSALKNGKRYGLPHMKF